MATPGPSAAPASQAWDWDWKTLDAIYNLRQPDEHTFYTKLNLQERDLFRLFATGVKLKHQLESKDLPSPGAVLDAWRDTDEIDREPYMLLAERQPDHRLHPDNFQVDPGLLQTFLATLSVPDQLAFESYVHGNKTLTPEYRSSKWHQGIINLWHQRIIDRWHQLEPRGIDRYIAYGRDQLNRFQTQPKPRRTPSGQGGHWFIYPKPDAQMSDIAFVNAIDPRPLGQPRRPTGSRWVFEKTICQNEHYTMDNRHTQRIIHLFALVAEDRQILKRMVVKIVGAPSHDLAVRDAQEEYHFHRILSSKNCGNILNAWGSSTRRRDFVPHLGYIYMEYAAFGDLMNLIDKLIREPNKQLPEPYLWLIFRGLAEALLCMERGTVIGRKHPTFENAPIQYDLRWKSIINPDIKPMNIMLGEAQNGYYPGYKTAKMIDFGLCFDDDRYTTAATKAPGLGTPGYTPPEQASPPHPVYQDYPINIFSEIFNVGLVMLSLMEGAQRTYGAQESNLGFFTHRKDYDKCYSQWLDDLVFQCLRFAPEQRPTLNQLLYRTRVGLEKWEKGYGSADKPEADLPDFATYPIDRREEFLIGQDAPDTWLGMKARKKRTAEEVGFAPAGPAIRKTRARPLSSPSRRLQKGNNSPKLPGRPPNGMDLGPKVLPEGPPIGLAGIGKDYMPPPPPYLKNPPFPAKQKVIQDPNPGPVDHQQLGGPPRAVLQRDIPPVNQRDLKEKANWDGTLKSEGEDREANALPPQEQPQEQLQAATGLEEENRKLGETQSNPIQLSSDDEE